MNGPRIVALGGGTGLPTLLRGVKKYTDHITAVVSMADDGGSSGRLRREMGILPPGDLRRCLVALAENEKIAAIIEHRFSHGAGLEGHNLGNLIICALCELEGDFKSAVEALGDMLGVKGQVLPCTLEDVTLRAATKVGDSLRGQVAIATTTRPLKRVYLDPVEVSACPGTVEAIEQADMLVIGPGSVFTSILPNLMVQDIAEAAKRSGALKVYVCNVMTQPGETDLFSAFDHISVIREHFDTAIDVIIVNSKLPNDEGLLTFAEQGRFPVPVEVDKIGTLGLSVVEAAVMDNSKPVYHDSDRLAATLMSLL